MARDSTPWQVESLATLHLSIVHFLMFLRNSWKNDVCLAFAFCVESRLVIRDVL